MDLLPKFGIYLGITIGVTVFAMFVIIAIPHMIQDAGRQWEEVFDSMGVSSYKTSEELEAFFQADPGYILFKEKYPDSGDNFRFHGQGRGNMEISAMNFENYNLLRFQINDDRGNHKLYYEAHCQNNLHDRNIRVSGELSITFIEKIDCLGDEGVISAPSNLVDKNGYPVPYKNYDLDLDLCGSNAQLSAAGVCIIVD